MPEADPNFEVYRYRDFSCSSLLSASLVYSTSRYGMTFIEDIPNCNPWLTAQLVYLIYKRIMNWKTIRQILKRYENGLNR